MYNRTEIHQNLHCVQLFGFPSINKDGSSATKMEFYQKPRVSVQGVESLWGDCRFIPADWGSQ